MAFWATITDKTSDTTNNNPNFDITQAGITDDGNLRLTVVGTVGTTTPSVPSQSNLIYAYVFITNAGIIAVTSHQGDDSGQVTNDLTWHTHRVTLDSNYYVTSIKDFGKA